MFLPDPAFDSGKGLRIKLSELEAPLHPWLVTITE